MNPIRLLTMAISAMFLTGIIFSSSLVNQPSVRAQTSEYANVQSSASSTGD